MKTHFEKLMENSPLNDFIMAKGRLEGEAVGIQKGIQKGVEKGREEGEIVGIEKGREESRLEMARVMKAAKEPIDKIQFYTNLSQEEIEKL